MKSLQLVGFLLWRSGLLLAAGWGAYLSISRFLRYFELPVLAEVGVALILTGVVFVGASFILERMADAREEGDLTQ